MNRLFSSTYLAAVCVSTSFLAKGQEMVANKFNCSSFPTEQADITEELQRLTPETYHQHPEFGRLPYNAPCEDCYELLQYRTDTTRLFVEKGSEGTKFLSQASYGLLCYQDENGNYISYDHRLRPSGPAGSGIFIADKQGVPVEVNVIEKQTVFYLPTGEPLVFNQHLNLFHYSSAGVMTDLGTANWSKYSAGEDGVKIADAWPGIDIELHVRLGEIKTNYIIKSNPGLADGHLVFKDNFSLPDDYVMTMPSSVTDPNSGKQIGEVNIEKENDVAATITPAFGYDASGIRENSQPFGYDISDNDLEIWVPVDWMNGASMVYPLTVDPLVTASATYTTGIMRFRINGSFCGGAGADCMYTLAVPRPANSTLTGATFSIVHETLFGSCFFICWLSDAGFYFSTTCGVNGYWGCNTDAAGTCTGSNLAINNLVTCLPPACSGNVNFNIFNSYCYCNTGGACGVSCQRINNNTWVVTISGTTLETLGNTTTGNGSQTINDADCIGTSVLNPSATSGVPGYTYSWSTGATSPTITVPNTPAVYTCTVTDACGVARVATFNMGCPLPIRLEHFTADMMNDHVDLQWQTKSEINSDYFIVQRAGGDGVFEDIATVDASENSSEIINYSWTDKEPLAGISYYRLAMVSLDATVDYSEARSVNNVAREKEIQVLPNPNNGVFQFTCTSAGGGEASLDILGPGGKIMKSKQLVLIKGTQTITIDCQDLPKGVYILRYSNDQKVITERLVIQ